MLIVDTGPLVAVADADDPDHVACDALLDTDPGPLVTTALVIAEAGFLIHRQVGPEAETALVGDVAEGRIVVETLTASDWHRTLELLNTYADLPLGVTDASLVALAERHRVERVATLDHRHFRVVRPEHLDAFTLLP
ncbi:MAG: PIN domain-containing protein [Acidimicrobiales bacterium]|nr:PIN domain-containing protein [Acidimicrobiales bacterium]